MADHAEQEPNSREKLIDATIAVILDVGLRGAKTRSVTERAGVGTGLLNHYFRWPELRALAWTRLFTAVTQVQFVRSNDPQADLERYFATAFTEEARRFWLLWSEAVELATSDEAMSLALGNVSLQSRTSLCDLLRTGCEQDLWHLPNPEATAVRLSAIYDGLAGMLLSLTAEMNSAQAEGHLRKAFTLECQSPHR